MTLPVDDSQWVLRINTTFDSQSQQYSLGLFSNPLIAIKVVSPTSLPSRRNGGLVSQSLIVDGDKIAFTAQEKLVLNKLLVYDFPVIPDTEYELFYFPLPRLAQVNIEVWEYTGEIKNALAEKIITAFESQPLSVQLSSEVTAQLTTLQTQIDNLMALFNQNPIIVPSLPQQAPNSCNLNNYAISNQVQEVAVINESRRGLILYNQDANQEILIGFPNLNNLPNDWFIKIPPQSFYEFPIPFAGALVAYSDNTSSASSLYVYEFFYVEGLNQVLLPD